MNLPSLNVYKEIRERISTYINKTPIVQSKTVNNTFGIDAYFKLELFQKTGSFKVRGAVNKILSLSNNQKKNGVIAISAGNHAQAVAWSSSIFGIKSKIVMPLNASKSKVNATKSYGGNVILTSENMMDVCNEIIKKEKRTMVHPFDDYDVIKGQGSISLEVLDKLKYIDNVFISIGGGGLISGMSHVFKLYNPNIKIYGVEPINSDVMSKSLQSGKVENFDTVKNKTIADTLAAPFSGKITLEYVKRFVDDIILVSESEMINSLKFMIERLKIIPEPSAAACFVPILNNKISIKPNSKCLILVCGGNVDVTTIKSFF
ncbi:MAG: threonine/serine dehydratase [Flammeovirgaceae bacterium TMED290]|nr:MAG: threonine/serine dehydratase [Flammeovirgaceae bacterium TMED290]